MKKIKYRLFILIFLSNTLLFTITTITFNIMIPKYLIKDAERALLNEISYLEGDLDYKTGFHICLKTSHICFSIRMG